MPEVHPLPLMPLYGASDKSTPVSKQRPGLRLLMKLSVALTATCTLLFLTVVVPHIHSHFYLISGSSGASHGAQYSSGDLAGLSDRIVPYKTRIGYFTYSKPLKDDRVIAIFQPRYAPGADVRDEVPSLRGVRPGAREQYIDDLYPEVLRMDPQFATGGMVSLIGLRFGASGSACKCNFGGVDALSCEVKSPELAIIQLPSAAHFQIFREANMGPSFMEVTLDSHGRVGVSRIHLNSDAKPHQSSDARKPSQASHQTIIYCQGHFQPIQSRQHFILINHFIRLSGGSPSPSAAARMQRRGPGPGQGGQGSLPKRSYHTRRFPTCLVMTLRESSSKPEMMVWRDECLVNLGVVACVIFLHALCQLPFLSN